MSLNKQNSPSDDVFNEYQIYGAGGILISIGVAAIAFSADSAKRSVLEISKIEMMWAKQMTIKKLQEMADRGEKLPEIVLVKGVIDADGPSIGSLTG